MYRTMINHYLEELDHFDADLQEHSRVQPAHGREHGRLMMPAAGGEIHGSVGEWLKIQLHERN